MRVEVDRSKAHAKWRRWTEDEVRTLVTEWQRRPHVEVAMMLGRTVAACEARLRKVLGSARTLAMTPARLARSTGYSCAQVADAIRALGLDVPKVSDSARSQSMLTDRQCRQIVDWLSSRSTRLDIARDLGVGVHIVASAARRIGLSMAETGRKHFTPDEERRVRAAVASGRDTGGPRAADVVGRASSPP